MKQIKNSLLQELLVSDLLNSVISTETGYPLTTQTTLMGICNPLLRPQLKDVRGGGEETTRAKRVEVHKS